jgi:hypothetical protein
MAQNTNVGDQTPAGAGENTNSPVSSENGQPIAGTPQSSQELLDLKKGYDRLEKELRGLQSRQDVEKNETQRFMAEVKKQMANGKSLEEAEAAVNASREAQVKDDLLFKMARKLGVLDDVSQNPAGNGGTVTEAAAQVISELKLDANSADVTAILARGFNAERQELELRRLATRPRPQPSAAESASILSGAASPSVDVDSLQIELVQLSKNPSAPGAAQRMTEIKKKLTEAGV